MSRISFLFALFFRIFGTDTGYQKLKALKKAGVEDDGKDTCNGKEMWQREPGFLEVAGHLVNVVIFFRIISKEVSVYAPSSCGQPTNLCLFILFFLISSQCYCGIIRTLCTHFWPPVPYMNEAFSLSSFRHWHFSFRCFGLSLLLFTCEDSFTDCLQE